MLLGVGITALVGENSQLNDLLDTDMYTGVAIVITVAGALIVLSSASMAAVGAFQESAVSAEHACLVLILFGGRWCHHLNTVLGSEFNNKQKIKTGLNNSIKEYNR